MRFIAFILAAALCLAPASAADVYRVQSDTNVLQMSAYDVVATAEWSSTQITDVLNYLRNIEIDTDDLSDTLTNFYNRFGYSSGSSLAADFDVLLDNFGFQNWGQSLREVLTGNRVYTYSLMDYLSMANAADTAFKSSFDSWVTSWNTVFGSGVNFGSYFNLVPGQQILYSNGQTNVLSVPISFNEFLRSGLLGLASQFLHLSGESYLDMSGSRSVLSVETPFRYIFSASMIGLSTNLKAITSGSYTLPLFMSDTGEDYTPTASTMGEMLNLYLQRMQRDMGQMAFIYADEETIQAKKDAAENEKAATDGFLKPGGPGSLSASDITSAAGAVGSAKDMLSTGVTPGQAFEQLQGSGPLEFFTSVTASNLNTVPSAASDLEDDDFVHFYDPSNSEFFKLIGKGGG